MLCGVLIFVVWVIYIIDFYDSIDSIYVINFRRKKPQEEEYTSETSTDTEESNDPKSQVINSPSQLQVSNFQFQFFFITTFSTCSINFADQWYNNWLN